MQRAKTNKLLTCACVLLATLLTGCASSHKKPVDTTNYSELASLNQRDAPGPKIASNAIRLKALKDTALELGAQGALAWKSEKLNKELLSKAIDLRNLYNFGAVVLPHGVMPPVLTEGSNTLNLNDPTTIRITDKTYKIVQNAHFVTAPPTWRDYLITHFKKPEVPNKVLLPKTAAEKRLWEKYIRIGWINGIKQANNIYNENLAKIKRDYNGMMLYRKLLAQHMVSPPFVATTDLGITGNRNQLNIGDKVLRISALPGLQKDSANWKAYVVENP